MQEERKATFTITILGDVRIPMDSDESRGAKIVPRFPRALLGDSSPRSTLQLRRSAARISVAPTPRLSLPRNTRGVAVVVDTVDIVRYRTIRRREYFEPKEYLFNSVSCPTEPIHLFDGIHRNFLPLYRQSNGSQNPIKEIENGTCRSTQRSRLSQCPRCCARPVGN